MPPLVGAGSIDLGVPQGRSRACRRDNAQGQLSHGPQLLGQRLEYGQYVALGGGEEERECERFKYGRPGGGEGGG